MKVLVLGGTRFFGVHMVNSLLADGHNVTVATRGLAKDSFGDRVNRITLDRTDALSIATALKGAHYDVICDNICYCSNDVRALLESVTCDRYVMTSTMSVYHDLHIDTKESEYNPLTHPFKWCDRADFTYDEVKRQSEASLFVKYPNQNAVAVRYPYVIGPDDYTKRLYFYVEHVVKGIPMQVDNLDSELAFIRSDEAGRFLSFLATNRFVGAINGGSEQTISIRDIITYVEKAVGNTALYSEDFANPAPYNGTPSYSINVDIAKQCGFSFTPLHEWIYILLDELIKQANND